MATDSSLPGLIYQIPSIVDPIALGDLFPRPQPLEVELGSGDGSFLVQHASLHPDHNFIGVERLLGRLRKIDKKGRRAHLENLRLMRIEAAYFLEYLLPPASVSALHIYFPDPWPKRRHRKNRLINERFPQLARRILQPGGKVFLRTDDADYFQQMERVFHEQAFFQPIVAPEELLSLLTDFEKGFRQQGLPIFNLARELRS